MIPRLDELANGDLVDLLERTRRELATTHTYEMLTGMLLSAQDGLSGAAMALRECTTVGPPVGATKQSRSGPPSCSV